MTVRGVRNQVVRAIDDTPGLSREGIQAPPAGTMEAAEPVAVVEMIQLEEAERPGHGFMKVWIMRVIVLALVVFAGAAAHATWGATTENPCVCVVAPRARRRGQHCSDREVRHYPKIMFLSLIFIFKGIYWVRRESNLNVGNIHCKCIRSSFCSFSVRAFFV